MATKPIENLHRMAKHIEMWLVDKLIGRESTRRAIVIALEYRNVQNPNRYRRRRRII